MSLKTVHADIRAAFRQAILGGAYPAITFTTLAAINGFTLTAAAEPGLDFRALGLRAGDYPLLAGFSKANNGMRRLTKVEASRLTFADKLAVDNKPSGASVSIAFDPAKIAWESEAFTPVKGVPWMQEVVQSAGSVVAGLGRGGLQRHKILATATLFYPSGQGTLGIESMAGRLLDQFKPGTGLVYGSSQGTVMQAEVKPLNQEPEWISCPVMATIAAWTTS